MTTRTLSLRTLRPRRARGILDLLGLWRQRRALASLDPHLLEDIGLAPEDAAAEAARPFWDVPDHWRH